MARIFKGVAFWVVDTETTLWAEKARDALLPLEEASLASISYACLPVGDQLVIEVGGDKHELLISGGKGRGVVRPSPAAPLILVCLVALRKALGGIDIVDDEQVVVPTVPRQNYPLFRDDWPAVFSVAQALGLVANQQVAAAMRNLIV